MGRVGRREAPPEGGRRRKSAGYMSGALVVTALLAVMAIGAALWAGGWLSQTPDKGDEVGLPVSVVLDEPEDEAPAQSEPENDPLLRQAQLDKIERLRLGYFYDEALAELESPFLTPGDAASLREQISNEKSLLVPFEGQAKHVFFHSLIVYPELAFDDKGHPAEGYNQWMTTVSEFKKMLPLLYENGYVLYNITDLVTFDENGVASRADIRLPEGKKPLVISVDDVNYYDYMEPDGFASRMVVDEDGKIATVVRDPEGVESVTYDGDVVPILDAFVEEHPDFSFRGAKGIVATTGYEGAWGYRITDLEGAELEAARAQVVKVSRALRETGWTLSCHSYTHNSYLGDGSVTLEEMRSDLDRWNERIRPYLEECTVYISAFGTPYPADDARYRYIIEHGFNIFCTVDAKMTTVYNTDNMVQSRLNLDGWTMMLYPERVKALFDPAKVLDPARPPM